MAASKSRARPRPLATTFDPAAAAAVLGSSLIGALEGSGQD